MTLPGVSYCVVMTAENSSSRRVVGPFDTQAAAVNWAVRWRKINPHWNYTPDVLSPPQEPDDA
jgi:hypothetical protein